jgi:nucleotide-binding universal stress UspA family protein
MKDTLRYSKITAALDLSSMDEKIIRFGRWLAGLAEAKTLEFIHVIPNFIFPEHVGSSFEELVKGDEPIEHRIQRKLAAEIQPQLDDAKGLEVKLETLHGDPMERLLMWSDKTHPDLLLLGKKTLSGNSGIVARRIARKLDCDLCFVTSKATTDIDNLLVPIDFSENSIKALRAAIRLQTKLDGVRITLLHVMDVPMTAYKINRNSSEIVEELRKEATKHFLSFLEEHKLTGGDFKMRTEINDEFDVSKYIQKAAQEEGTDLIVVGAKGHSGMPDIVFGSVTEKLVGHGNGVPIWVIR